MPRTGALRRTKAGWGLHPRLPTRRTTLPPCELRPPLVDGPGPGDAAAVTRRNHAGWNPGLRVHDRHQPAHRSRPREQRLLDALLIDSHDLRRCLRPLPAFESWLGRTRNGLGAPLAAADGFHLPRAACARPGLEVA